MKATDHTVLFENGGQIMGGTSHSHLTGPTHSSEGWATRIARQPQRLEQVSFKRSLLLSRNDTFDRSKKWSRMSNISPEFVIN